MSHTLPPVEEILDAMSAQLQPLVRENSLVVGIHTGGVWVAEQLHANLCPDSNLGTIDITFYRDDFSTIGLHPQVNTSYLADDIEDRHIILIDDVLQTGRTIKAALNEIFSYGRPQSVTLAVLVDRGMRELPIQADVCGIRLTLDSSQQIKLIGADNLILRIMDKPE